MHSRSREERAHRMRLAAGLAALGMILLACSWVAFGSELSDLLAQAEAVYDRWSGPFDFTAYESELSHALGLWGQALPLIPETDIQTRAHVLHRLAFGYHDYHVYFSETTYSGWTSRERLLEISFKYALDRLRLDPDFCAAEEAEGITAALRGSNDAPALFAYGNSYGKWLSHHPREGLLGGVERVLAAFERTLEVDETYFRGGAHFALAALIAQAFFLIPYDFHDAEPLYERALEVNPDNVEALTSYALDYAAAAWNVTLQLELLDRAVERAESPDFVGYDPLYDYLAIRALYEYVDKLNR